jgi:hypothetical protein
MVMTGDDNKESDTAAVNKTYRQDKHETISFVATRLFQGSVF